MQKIKLDVFKSWFGKDLTGKEIDFLIALSFYQNERGIVRGVYYKDMMEDAEMSVQTFYDCKRSLMEKGVITATVMDGTGDYDIVINGNDFSLYTQEDYNKGQVKYLRMNAYLFRDINFKKLKPKQKLLVMDLYHIQNAGAPRCVQAYRIRRENFIKKYANGTNPDGTQRKGLLDITERTLQKYLKMLKLYFSVGIKEGIYFFTIRKQFQKKAAEENTVAMAHLLKTACRRNKITDEDKEEAEKKVYKKEWKDILYILLNHRKEIVDQEIDVGRILCDMIQVLNASRLNKRTWKRRLKASLFAKLLKEAIA